MRADIAKVPIQTLAMVNKYLLLLLIQTDI
jgi:hypothetical protein